VRYYIRVYRTLHIVLNMQTQILLDEMDELKKKVSHKHSVGRTFYFIVDRYILINFIFLATNAILHFAKTNVILPS